MTTLNNTKELTKTIDEILDELPERYKDIIVKRFGLSDSVSRHTLESIGQNYSITRERVRQLENKAKKIITESEVLITQIQDSLKELKKKIDSFGGVVPQRHVLSEFSDDEKIQNYIHFLLHIGDYFNVEKHKDLNDDLWYTKKESVEAVKKSLHILYKNIKNNQVLTEEEIINKFLDYIKEHSSDKRLLKLAVVKKLISVSKKIGSNKLKQWGLAEARHIHLRGLKDYAYLALKDYGKPLHFTKIAEKVAEKFDTQPNVATIHNELIKDDRFILVGRGIYALKEWDGYEVGTVTDIIKKVLKQNKKAMTKQEIAEEVLKIKDVKEQTVYINLAKKDFYKTKDGKYKIAKNKK